MLNIIIVSDDSDPEIGSNCSLSHEHLISNVNLAGNNLVLLNQDLCTAEQVEKSIGTFDGQSFILVAFSHGCDEALVSSIETTGYLSDKNAYFFSSSFVYTNCCHSGNKLKDNLAHNGCKGFVGYTDVVRLPINEDDDILFIDCENSALIHFLNTGDSLSKSMDIMRNKYSEQYENFLNQNMNVAAAFLLHNLNSLTFYDQNTLKREDLES